MSYLDHIEARHGRDGWRDVVFIAAALLLTALAVGATTSNGVGKPSDSTWSVRVVDPDTQLEMR